MLGVAGQKIDQNKILIILDTRLIWNSNLNLKKSCDEEGGSKIEKKEIKNSWEFN